MVEELPLPPEVVEELPLPGSDVLIGGGELPLEVLLIGVAVDLLLPVVELPLEDGSEVLIGFIVEEPVLPPVVSGISELIGASVLMGASVVMSEVQPVIPRAVTALSSTPKTTAFAEMISCCRAPH